MRDGIRLFTVIYSPIIPGKFPIMIERTPYGATNTREDTVDFSPYPGYAESWKTKIYPSNDRTITQLKNSGNMRIIRNQKVNDSIIYYWNHIENVKQALSRHMFYRSAGRELETKIYNIGEMYLRNSRHVDVSSADIKLIPHSSGLLEEYANIVASSGIMLGSLRTQITAQYKLAVQLLQLIKKEYHLE